MKITILTALLTLNLTITAQNWNVSQADHWVDSTLTTTSDGISIYNEVWGFVENSKEYACIGSTEGTHFFKVENNQLELIQFVRGNFSSWQVIHRDYHDYNGYLYEVCDEGSSTLRIYDLQYLPDSVRIVYDSDNLIIRAHNVYIDTARGTLYACGVANNSGLHAMQVYDLSNPVNPILVKTLDAVDYVHDVFVRNDTIIANCGTEGLYVFKLVGSQFFELGSLTFYLDMGYNHSGWLSEDGKTYIMCDETEAMRFKVVDVANFANMEVLALAKPNTYPNTLPHNVMFKNGIAYFSYYNDGLQIYNIRNPQNPERIGYFDSYEGSDDDIYMGCWGIYAYLPSQQLLISDRKNGLYLLNFTPPPASIDTGELGPKFTLYPNPCSDFIWMYNPSNNPEQYTLQFFDELGKKIFELTSHESYVKINVQKWAIGSYFYQFKNTKGNIKREGKILITR